MNFDRSDISGTWARPVPPKAAPAQPLPRAYGLIADGKTDEALDLLFDLIDALLSAGQVGECNRILERIDVNALDVDTMIGLLSITLSAKERLVTRRDFLERVEAKLQLAHSAHELSELLNGLR